MKTYSFKNLVVTLFVTLPGGLQGLPEMSLGAMV